jgi:hypothetical protein
LRSPAWLVLLSAAVTLAGMLTKPNYGIALLPACAVMAVWFLWKRRPLDWPLLIWGQAVPILVSLAYQATLIYLIPDAGDTGVFIIPFAVEAYWSSYLPLKLLLSILFPLSVLWLLRRELARDDELLLALLAFAVSLVHLYFFAESGDRFAHANFRWGSQTTLFILFVIAVRRLLALRDKNLALPPINRPHLWPAYSLYLLHLAAGIAYYIYAYVQPQYN